MQDGLLEHAVFFLSGSTALAVIGHAVNTFPTPTNKYALWLLGVVQYIVGQRTQGSQTLGVIKNESSTQK